jgi:hypothetical protein
MDKDTPEARTCKACGKEKSIDQYWHYAASSRADGWQRTERYDQTCKACRSAVRSARYRARKAGKVPPPTPREVTAKRNADFVEDVTWLLGQGVSVPDIAARYQMRPDVLRRRMRELGSPLPDPRERPPIGRQEADELCQRATRWLYRRYAERGYSTDLVAEMSGAHMGGGLARKTARRHGIAVDAEYRLSLDAA